MYRSFLRRNFVAKASGAMIFLATLLRAGATLPDGQYLYVAVPGIRADLEFGGHGLLVFDVDHAYKLVRRIPTGGLGATGRPENVKGICVSPVLGRIYISTLSHLTCVDLVTEQIRWEKTYEGGCDRMAINPAGNVIYLPSLEGPHWHVVDAATGDVIGKIVVGSGSHNTIFGRSGKAVYLAGLNSPVLSVVDPLQRKVVRTVGPFSDSIRPFTVNGAESRVYVNVNKLLGFEVGDLVTGKMLQRVEVEGFDAGPEAGHGCPSHGIALTPDGRELWIADGHNSKVHIFDLTSDPVRTVGNIALRDQPGWISMRLDGKQAWLSTGEIIDTASRKVVATLSDEQGADVQSEKMVEVHWKSGAVSRCGDQFGYARN